jgi:hypothetical protein
VKFAYVPVTVAQPQPSLAGGRLRYRPVIAVRLTGPTGFRLRDGLLDTGADDTVFSETVAADIGIDLLAAEVRQVQLASRPQPLVCRYASVHLLISDGQQTCEWTAVVGFVAGRLNYNLLGHAGFLQFFRAEFDGEDREITLTPRPSFPGRHY